MRRSGLMIAALCALGLPALAEAPNVATDIAPVQSLVAQIMAGVGTPALILPPGASPHGYAMRPSEAAALDAADLGVWIGPRLTPWLADAVETLAGDAETLELLDVDATLLLNFREGPIFEAHDDGDTHADEDHDAHGHGHFGLNPHAWLDPSNAKVWLGAIADALAGIDPSNAERYRANAARAEAAIDTLAAGLSETLAPAQGVPFIVFHDAYQYFENRFDIHAAGAVSEGDAARPGPKRIAAIRALSARTDAVCVFTEPQFPAGLVATVTEGTSARTGVLDPLGARLEPGPGLYAEMMHALADTLRGCLDPGR